MGIDHPRRCQKEATKGSGATPGHIRELDSSQEQVRGLLISALSDYLTAIYPVQEASEKPFLKNGNGSKPPSENSLWALISCCGTPGELLYAPLRKAWVPIMASLRP